MLNQKYHLFLTPLIACLFICFSHLATADEYGFVTLSSPDTKTINDLKILSFRGLPVTGSHLKVQTMTAEQKKTWRAGNIYTDLMRMKFTTTKPNAARLKQNFNSGTITPNYTFDEFGDNAWYLLFSQLASSSLTDGAYTQYGCKKEPCDHAERARKGSPNIINWGGSQANQFESRRAFSTFIDTELNKYLTWTKSFDTQPEVYSVGKTHLSPYIFEKGGFAVKLFPANTVLPISQNLNNHRIFKNQVEDSGYAGILVKVNEAEAEKIIERAQRKQIFFVYKTKLTIADKSYNQKTKQLMFHQLTFDQAFTSDVIEVFAGPELQDKLFDIPL